MPADGTTLRPLQVDTDDRRADAEARQQAIYDGGEDSITELNDYRYAQLERRGVEDIRSWADVAS